MRRNWGWFLALGVLLIILGTIALGYAAVATVVWVLFFGWLLLIGGVMEVVSAFMARLWSGFFLQLLAGILEVVVGLLILVHPEAAAVGLTLLLAVFFIVGGVFHMVGALTLRFPNWGWSVLSGLVTLLLGILVWSKWPYDSLWFIGLCVAIYLIFHGWSWVILALAIRSRSQQTPTV
jgi:uncharacterized membrane protein HdeD (DUF308 family)